MESGLTEQGGTSTIDDLLRTLPFDATADTEEREREETALFRCPACDDVYVAVAEDTCSKCGGVEAVPSTLTDD